MNFFGKTVHRIDLIENFTFSLSLKTMYEQKLLLNIRSSRLTKNSFSGAAFDFAFCDKTSRKKGPQQ